MASLRRYGLSCSARSLCAAVRSPPLGSRMASHPRSFGAEASEGEPDTASTRSVLGGAQQLASVEGSSASDADTGGGLFCDLWWPTVADHCHRRLAQRPQGLPEDPLAQGVLSWVEYELARKAPPSPGGAEKAVERSCRDENPTPLPADGDWRWLLRGKGEIVGPKGDRG
uniref:Uncharacterized protein n=1 Tax=Alexandrium monilatum TaxID=311494 RepID=A0A7S4V5W0_9DINO